MFLIKRMDFWKKEKNATRQEAQNATSTGEGKSTRVNKLGRISGVIGNFCLVDASRTLFNPFSNISICQQL